MKRSMWRVGTLAVAGVMRFLASRVFAVLGRLRMVPVMANGQPAFAVYQREPDGVFRAHEVLVPTLAATGIARIVVLLDPGLVTAFGLPQESGAGAPAPGGA